MHSSTIKYPGGYKPSRLIDGTPYHRHYDGSALGRNGWAHNIGLMITNIGRSPSRLGPPPIVLGPCVRITPITSRNVAQRCQIYIPHDRKTLRDIASCFVLAADPETVAKPITVIVSGGCVQGIQNIPPGMAVEIHDYDVDAGDHHRCDTDAEGGKFLRAVHTGDDE
ncbi:MAG: hypothetical protein MI755_16380 [Sphingomonadales bacterium]|nr:hypothetical protein [Sphingomonadales bacterium]